MPFVNIKLAAPGVRAEQVARLQAGATRLMAEVLRKKPELTAVLVEQVHATAWAIGGEPVQTGAHLDVKITAGTNTPEEKARFIRDATALLKDVLGAGHLPLATYVVVHEVAADSWGYDGLTQKHRRLAAVR